MRPALNPVEYLDFVHVFVTATGTKIGALYRLNTCIPFACFTHGRNRLKGLTLAEQHSISIAVLTDNQDDVELINRTLRDAGHAAHCHWIPDPTKFSEVLQSEQVELLILNCDRYPDSVRQVAKQKDCYIPEVPVIAVGATADEDSILRAMRDGACDLVSLATKARLEAVVSRELRALRVERALNSTLSSATAYRRQLNDYMQGSSSAIAHVQEGIVVEVNRAWLKMFEARDRDEILGLPLMDSFLEESQAAIKGALIATTRNKWHQDEKLIAKSRCGEGDAATLELEFQLTDFDDGPCIQIRIAPPANAPEEPTKLVHEALKRDPTTLFFHRAQFLERIAKRLKRKPKSGLHLLTYIKPDDFAEIQRKIGIIDTEEVLSQLAEEIRKRLHPRDVAGRFEGTVIAVLLERGNVRDAEVWGQQLVEHIQAMKFKIGDQEVQLTCTVGIVGISGVYDSLEEIVSAVAEAHQQGRSAGGNAVFLSDAKDEDTRLKKYDAIWVKRINAALKENRFRLAQLPIAGLRSDSSGMYDMLVRMIDEQGQAILPSEFLPAAERNNLMKTLDRWVMSASIEHCATNAVEQVFVRLSRPTMLDASLTDWLGKELDSFKVEGNRICLQVPEQEAAKYIKDTKKTVECLGSIGVNFALEHYGVDKNRFQILDLLKPKFIKIDGELMHSLMTDTSLQEAVRQLASAAEQRGVETIAERVENANAMAVLFQLGVHFMQGHYVHEPEVVLQEAVSVVPTTLEAIGNS